MGTPIGRILLIPRGDYSSVATYNSLDWVRHSGSAWVCKVDNTSGVAPAAGVPEWQLLVSDGSVGGWGSLANKPFETLGAGLKEAADHSLTLVIGDTLLLGSKLDVAARNTYTGTGTSSDKPISGQGVKDALDTVQDGTTINTFAGVESALSGKANTTDLDTFTPSATCYADSSLVKVQFDDLNASYGYELFFDDQNQALPTPIPTPSGDPVKTSGTNMGIKLTYTLSNATAGTHKFALRILK